MIIKQFDLYDFKKEFESYDRGDNFSDEGLEELFDYYDDFGEPYELDVIEICCNWTEYENLDEFATAYGYTEEVEGMEEEEKEQYLTDILNDNTCYFLLSDGGVVVQDY